MANRQQSNFRNQSNQQQMRGGREMGNYPRESFGEDFDDFMSPEYDERVEGQRESGRFRMGGNDDRSQQSSWGQQRTQDSRYRNFGMNQGGMNSGQRSNRTNRGPKGYVRSDERIKEDLCDQLMDHELIDSSEVEITVKSGEITLSGTVDQRHHKHAIEDLADNVRGAKDVINNIKVKREQQLGSTSSSGQGKQQTSEREDDGGKKNRSTVSPS